MIMCVKNLGSLMPSIFVERSAIQKFLQKKSFLSLCELFVWVMVMAMYENLLGSTTHAQAAD